MMFLQRLWQRHSFNAGLERAAVAAEKEASSLSSSPCASMAESIVGPHCLRDLAKTIRSLKKETKPPQR